jgi:hypothetical protein
MRNSVMRATVLLISTLAALALVATRSALAFNADTTADAALGTTDLNAAISCDLSLPSASTLCSPRGVAVDPTSGRVFVADSGYARVVSWANT